MEKPRRRVHNKTPVSAQVFPPRNSSSTDPNNAAFAMRESTISSARGIRTEEYEWFVTMSGRSSGKKRFSFLDSSCVL
jgi:hypothetical protein